MVDKRVTTRLSGREAVRVGVPLTLAVLMCGVWGCSKGDKELSAIKNEYAGGDFDETVMLCDRALRKGATDAEIFFYWGLALLSLERDVEAFDRLKNAVSTNGMLSADISNCLVEKARESIARGMMPQAARRLRTAVELHSGVDVGPLEYLVAESYFEDKRWEEAVRHYTGALAEYPDTSAAEMGYFNLASCYAAAGDSVSAIEVLEKQLAEFPRGAIASQAEWSLANLLYDRALSEFQRGNYDRAIVLARGIIDRTENGVAVQRARFLLGESFERKGDYAAAYEQYQSIIRDEQGASGRLVERARRKIAAIRDAGLR